MAIRMQQRQGTADQWLTADPVLGAGEIGFETDTNSFKIGDGVNSWTLLDYFTNETGLAASLSDYILSTEKAAANGVATLDSNGFVPASQLANATVDLTGYATETYVGTAISAIPAPDFTGLATETYADTAAATAAAAVVDAAPGTLDTLNELAAALGDDANFATTVTNSIAAKADTLHNHSISQVTDLQTTLDGKQDVVAGVSDTEIGYLDGVTSNIQAQLDGKSATSHTHDDRYYTETETDTLLNGKADLSGATFTGNVEGATVRLTSETDVTLSSTAHAFQIGSDASQNLAFDGNEIQSRNNGAAGTLIVNADGGNVYVGTLSNGVGFGKSETEGKVWANGVYDNTLTTAYRSVYVSSTGTLDFLGYVASSSREKKNIEPLGYTAEQILLVEPKQYHYNAEADTDPKHAGMIAEDMHDAGLTAFVSYDKEGLPASINYEFYVAALQQVVRAQAEQIASLDARLTALEG